MKVLICIRECRYPRILDREDSSGGSFNEERKDTQETLNRYTERRKPAGRPRGRWIYAVDRDAKRMLKCKKGKRSAEDKD